MKNKSSCIVFLIAASSVFASSAQTATSGNADWNGCLHRLQPLAQQTGVKSSTWQNLMPAITPDMSVLDKLDNQPEFKTWDYIANLVDDERIAQGQHLLKEHQPD